MGIVAGNLATNNCTPVSHMMRRGVHLFVERQVGDELFEPQMESGRSVRAAAHPPP